MKNYKKRILIVDDDEAITAAIASVLEENPMYQVTTTNNPYEAYNLASVMEYDLVISDVDMPSLRGDMLYLCLGVDAEDNRRPHKLPKLLLISGMIDEDDLRASMRFVGGADYLPKPFDADTLSRKVASLVREDPRGEDDPMPERLERKANFLFRCFQRLAA
jgi:DNA-binding response OmpR family regulator